MRPRAVELGILLGEGRASGEASLGWGQVRLLPQPVEAMRKLSVRSNAVVAAALVLGAAAGLLPERARAAEPAASFTDTCRRAQEIHVRSAARKLYRALRGEHELQPLMLQPWVDAAIDGRPVRFELHVEHDELVGGLVPEGPNHATTYVVAQTASGPVVAELTWKPAGASCEVADSRLAYPPVASDRVRPEPFRQWGQRVVWHVPRERKEGGARDLYAALVTIFRGSTAAQEAPATAAPATASERPPAQEPSAQK